MLTTLRVKNLALVENVTVEFGPGLNMVTGETGAGKSILLGALDLLLGERADRTLIRAGQDACGAEAVFELGDSSEVDEVLEDLGLDVCDGGQLVLRRIIRASGGGQILVNDSPVTLQALKRLGQHLVDMHGPHDHQSLLQPEAQLNILDAFGHAWGERSAYEKVYRRLRDLETRRESMTADSENIEEQLDLLRHRAKEIEGAALKADEEEEIIEKHKVVGNAQRILELGQMALQASVEGEPSAFDLMVEAKRALDEMARLLPEAEAWREEVQDVTHRLQEIGAAVGSRLDSIGGEPERLDWLDQRLTTYQKLKRKYGPTVEDVLRVLDETKQRLQRLENLEEELETLDAELSGVKAELEQVGGELHAKREVVSLQLAEAITVELQALGFQHGAFGVDVVPSAPSASGLDAVEFGFAPNVGEPMRPLRAIASSGEISRVMLATKAVLARHDRIPVLVFDEIDANLGGEMGHAVGSKLAAVAKTHQVVCITHLPQVAVHGTTHYAVSKHVENARTLTRVERLEGEEHRVREVARMLGGREDTPVTLDHARELLRKR